MESKLRSNLVREFERVLIYESPALQEKARHCMPVQELHERARSKLSIMNKEFGKDEKPLDFQDCVLVELLAWFKNDFFKWFDAPTCPQCHSKMTSAGSLLPTEDDLAWGGSRVEGYSCRDCGTTDRFVRYNHPAKLLETRQGRCGEWANCFTHLCRTLGMDARYVHDYTDHVWTEVFSQSQNRWLHADCCENKLDNPLIYENGWGKKLTYIFAFSRDEVVDVTWRYTTKQNEVLKRRNEKKQCCEISWVVDWSHTGLKAISVLIVFQHATFESGSVTWQLCTGDKCFLGNKEGVLELFQCDLEHEASIIELSARLLNGQGENAWQHAQLFRQSDSSLDQFPFLIHIKYN
nr:peptide-N(4)-(N-acetyl-beta-glucosaminyl)asparagine amidase-like [Cherax quadricarinatus]